MKYAKDGTKIPERCPLCRSRKTMLSTYRNGERFIECEGCYTVIENNPPVPTKKRRAS